MSAPILKFRDEPMTRREIEIARTAFVDGVSWDIRAWQKMQQVDYSTGQDEIAESRQRYPLPKVTRPRKVVWEGNTYRWTPLLGLQVRMSEKVWASLDGCCIIESRRAVLADLLANPTEECEDES